MESKTWYFQSFHLILFRRFSSFWVFVRLVNMTYATRLQCFNHFIFSFSSLYTMSIHCIDRSVWYGMIGMQSESTIFDSFLISFLVIFRLLGHPYACQTCSWWIRAWYFDFWFGSIFWAFSSFLVSRHACMTWKNIFFEFFILTFFDTTHRVRIVEESTNSKTWYINLFWYPSVWMDG